MSRNAGRSGSVFGRAAATYGRVGPNLFGYFGSRVVDLLDVQPGWCVLDVGCGAGAALNSAKEAVGPSGRAVGIDPSIEMVSQARLADRRSLVALMDALHLGVRDGSVDAITTNFALTYFESPVVALAECRRVLRPGGHLGLVVSDGWWWQDDNRWSWYRQVLSDLGELEVEPPRPFREPAQIEAAVRAAGFPNVTTTVESFDLTWTDANQWWTWCWSHGYREVLERVSAGTLDSLHRACMSHLGQRPVQATLPVIVTLART